MTKFVNRTMAVALLIATVALLGGCNTKPAPDKDGTSKKEGKGGDPKPSGKGETPYIATIPHMEDEGCVASIKKEVEKLAWVAKVECDIPNKKATVTPKAGAKASARELWEALDRAGESASKLDGPDGLFTSKPEK